MFVLNSLISSFSRVRAKRNVRNSIPDGFIGTDIERLDFYEQYCSWPSTYYFKTIGITKLFNPKTIVEVGVAYGYHAKALLSANNAVSYVGIDPYRPGYDEKDSFAADVCEVMQDQSPTRAFDRLYTAVSQKLQSEFGPRARIIRQPSQDAAKTISDGSIDFVFVDGDHRYEQVQADLEAWWSKIRLGGIMCGDDWEWPGVSRAVQEFALIMKVDVLLIASPKNSHLTWLIYKQK